jgi:hypothetical protein
MVNDGQVLGLVRHAVDDSDDDQDNDVPAPRASSTSDATGATRTEESSMPAFRSVVSVLLRELGDFLYTLKAGPAGGRLRRPSSAGEPVWAAGPQKPHR